MDVLCTMLHHLRRVKTDATRFAFMKACVCAIRNSDKVYSLMFALHSNARYKQLSHKSQTEHIEAVDDLLGLLEVCQLNFVHVAFCRVRSIHLFTYLTWQASEEPASMDRDPSPAPTKAYPSRDLKREVSLDDDGFPLFLSSVPQTAKTEQPRPDPVVKTEPASTPVLKRKVEVTHASSTAVSWTKKPKACSSTDKFVLEELVHDKAFLDQLTHDVFERDETPAPQVVEIAKAPNKDAAPTSPKRVSAPKVKAVAKSKSKAGAKAGITVGNNKKLGKLKAGLYGSQSYITHQLPGSPSKRLVVAISAKQTVNHQALCVKLLSAIVTKNMDKAGAIAERQKLLDAES